MTKRFLINQGILEIFIKVIKVTSKLHWCILMFLSFSIQAQTDIELLQELAEEDRTIVNALVMYPEDTRESIFILSQHPELLIRIEGLQKKVKEKFIDIISEYEQEEQEKYYEILRYEGLIKELVEGGSKSKSEIEQIVSDLPEESQKYAIELGRKKYDDLKKIYDLNASTQEAFQKIIDPYDQSTQSAVRQLAKLPETLSLLTESINLTILIGNVYTSEPDWVRRKADSLNLEIARQNAEELEDYKNELENNPEAYQEMLEAGEQYAKDNGHEKEIKEEVTEASMVHVVHHYPYWYGYPHWYTSPIWAPVPWYYHTGFYYGPGGGAVFIGFPSSYYMGWQYRYYPNRYVHLNTHYHYHYHRHPHSHNHFNSSVNININNNRNINVNNRINQNTNINRNTNVNRSGKRPSATSRSGSRTSGNIQNRPNIQSKPGGSYDRHRAADAHRQNWGTRGSSVNRSMPSGGARRSAPRRR